MKLILIGFFISKNLLYFKILFLVIFRYFFSFSTTNSSKGLFLLNSLTSSENLSANSFNAKLNIRVDQPEPNSNIVVLLLNIIIFFNY